MDRVLKGRTLEFELRKPFDALVSAANRENGWVVWSGWATALEAFGAISALPSVVCSNEQRN
jgi:hypothetical protein